MAADGAAPPARNVCFTMHGIGVSGGIAIGHAHLFLGMSTEVDHYQIPSHEVSREQRRFDRAVKEVREELKGLAESVRHSAASELAPFVNVHLMLLEDAAFSEAPREIIAEKKCNAEWALRTQLDELTAQFGDIQDEYLRERETDVRQVAERILTALAGSKRLLAMRPTREDADMILVARDLSPADVILFREHPFAAFVTDMGGATSHTAIIARSLAIPAIVALHHARTLIREDELIIVDGTQGVVIVNPDRAVLAEYRLRQNQARLEREKLKRLKSAPAATLDGTPVHLYANIELPSDLDAVKAAGAAGIGLFRSEFLFMNRRDLPDEDEQYEAYRSVVEGMKGRPVTIRTLDIGADKALDGGEGSAENPALGLRAIRYCLAEPKLFNTQLRAILRASRHGKAAILIPMLSSWAELNQAAAAVERAKEELKAEGVKFDPFVPVGGMIEIPAAAIALPMFVRKLDFLSIGTNDLIQYTLAIDRTDDSVAHLYDPLHPAVLSLIAGVIRTAQQAEKPAAVCGEMAGDVALTRLLLGMGLRHFSMHPASLLPVKQRVLTTSLPDIAPLVARILKADDPEKLVTLVEKLNA
ncbi:MAG TPA: phosphoenolpyruvate--protein phosphotransferase [Usitatibacteraceae bacterium]|mgnify:FL=1|nr:phosphoenolpyruvate--protein phosphotransferase [Burkholderiales bacterium]HQW37834.1 phosphoenolpyruvate--protein phosphotransferase [Usitatibacteraceae bacterium]HRA24122.1 phosphoenolpyruvate--protein phosphotransferase [Usitatibacteraceae bacterium]